MEYEQGRFDGWAVVEMMGHQREVGLVTTEAYGVSVFFRVCVPEIPEKEEILDSTWYGYNAQREPIHYIKGSKVVRPTIPARFRLLAPSSIYAINPVSEHFAKAEIERCADRPIILIEAPPRPALLPQPTMAETESTALEAEYPESDPEFKCCGRTPEEGHLPGCAGLEE